MRSFIAKTRPKHGRVRRILQNDIINAWHFHYERHFALLEIIQEFLFVAHQFRWHWHRISSHSLCEQTKIEIICERYSKLNRCKIKQNGHATGMLLRCAARTDKTMNEFFYSIQKGACILGSFKHWMNCHIIIKREDWARTQCGLPWRFRMENKNSEWKR